MKPRLIGKQFPPGTERQNITGTSVQMKIPFRHDPDDSIYSSHGKPFQPGRVAFSGRILGQRITVKQRSRPCEPGIIVAISHFGGRHFEGQQRMRAGIDYRKSFYILKQICLPGSRFVLPGQADRHLQVITAISLRNEMIGGLFHKRQIFDLRHIIGHLKFVEMSIRVHLESLLHQLLLPDRLQRVRGLMTVCE